MVLDQYNWKTPWAKVGKRAGQVKNEFKVVWVGGSRGNLTLTIGCPSTCTLAGLLQGSQVATASVQRKISVHLHCFGDLALTFLVPIADLPFSFGYEA